MFLACVTKIQARQTMRSLTKSMRKWFRILKSQTRFKPRSIKSTKVTDIFQGFRREELTGMIHI